MNGIRLSAWGIGGNGLSQASSDIKAGNTVPQRMLSSGRLRNIGKTNLKDNETSFIHPDIRAQQDRGSGANPQWQL